MIEKSGLYKCKKTLDEEVHYYEDDTLEELHHIDRVILTEGKEYYITLTGLNLLRPYQNLKMVGDNGNTVRMSDYDSDTGIDLKGEKFSDYIKWYFKDYFYTDEIVNQIEN